MLGRNFIQFLILGILLAVLGYVWYRIPLPCAMPLEYSLGQFDPRFNISQEKFLSDVAAAEKPWETALGKNLLQYSFDAPFKINLMYDERQARTIEQQKLESERLALERSQTNAKMTQAKLLSTFNAKKAAYEKNLISFQGELSSYNSEVEYWNGHGGAPRDEYKKLQNQKRSLQREQSGLESARSEINALASQINATSKQSVSTVNAYNDKVEDFVSQYGNGHEDFDEGIYTSQEIDIYQFEDEAHLKAVLAHELGHWIGLDHVSNPASIMYPLMGGQDLVHLSLSPEDKDELQMICQKSRFDIMKEKLQILLTRLKEVGV